MNILIDGKEVFVNASMIVTVKDISTGDEVDDRKYEIELINGDKIQLEYYSFLYYRNYSSSDWASFTIANYRGTLEDLKKNKYIKKS